MLSFETGEIIAERYRIKGKIGKGGMGMVYMVRDITTGQRCALKTLLPQYAKEKRVVERFIREVNTQRKMDHPGIIKVFGARQVEGTLFYVMEYIDGVSVRDMLKRGRIDMHATFRILYLLCEALEHAHQKTVHRDISPDNVMVLRDGSVKLLDFGLAKLTESESDLTRTGVFIGKIHYGAPEQSVDAKNVDLRADIFSVGVMIHEMLSGDLPFANKKFADLVPELPTEVDDLVDKARALDPEDRFQTADELRHELVRVYGIATDQSFPDPEVYDDEIPDFVTEASETVELLKQYLVAPKSSSDAGVVTDADNDANTPTIHRTPKSAPVEAEPAAAKVRSSAPARVAAPSGRGGQDSEALETLKQELKEHEESFEQLREGMKLLAAQMQDFLDEQLKSGTDAAAERKEFQGLNLKLGEKQAEIDRLEAELAKQREEDGLRDERFASIEQRLLAMEASTN